MTNVSLLFRKYHLLQRGNWFSCETEYLKIRYEMLSRCAKYTVSLYVHVHCVPFKQNDSNIKDGAVSIQDH